MTQFTHWLLFDSAVVVVVDVAAVVGYRPPTHQLPHQPKLLIGKVRACSLWRPALPVHSIEPHYRTSQRDGDQNGKCGRGAWFLNLSMTTGRHNTGGGLSDLKGRESLTTKHQRTLRENTNRVLLNESEREPWRERVWEQALKWGFSLKTRLTGLSVSHSSDSR